MTPASPLAARVRPTDQRLSFYAHVCLLPLVCLLPAQGNLGEFWEAKELALLLYAKAMTVACADREGLAATFQAAKSAGANDGEMLEINQVVGYCNYANRTLNGLGVSLAGDTVGFYKEGATESEGGQRGAEKL